MSIREPRGGQRMGDGACTDRRETPPWTYQSPFSSATLAMIGAIALDPIQSSIYNKAPLQASILTL